MAKLWVKGDTHREGKFLVVRRDGTVPHWPHHVIGARDPAAPHALRAYADKHEQLGSDPEYVASVREYADDFETYRLVNGAGDPVAPPHRTDSVHVIAAMRGEVTNINVYPDKVGAGTPDVEFAVELIVRQAEETAELDNLRVRVRETLTRFIGALKR